MRANTTKTVQQPVARGADQSDEDTENDEEQKEQGLRRRVKIMKKFRKRNNRSGVHIDNKVQCTAGICRRNYEIHRKIE